MAKAYFEWDEGKGQLNRKKHGVSFFGAQNAFLDPHHIIAEDIKHSSQEQHYYLFW